MVDEKTEISKMYVVHVVGTGSLEKALNDPPEGYRLLTILPHTAPSRQNGIGTVGSYLVLFKLADTMPWK